MKTYFVLHWDSDRQTYFRIFQTSFRDLPGKIYADINFRQYTGARSVDDICDKINTGEIIILTKKKLSAGFVIEHYVDPPSD